MHSTTVHKCGTYWFLNISLFRLWGQRGDPEGGKLCPLLAIRVGFTHVADGGTAGGFGNETEIHTNSNPL